VIAGGFLATSTLGMSFPVVPRLVSGPLAGGSRAVGVVVGAFAVASVLCRPAVAKLGDRRGHRALLLLGGVVSSIGLLLHVWADSILALALARGAAGLGFGATMVGLFTAALDAASAERQGEAASYLTIAITLGLGLGPIAGEWLLLEYGSGAVWVGATAAAGAGTVIVLRGLPRAAIGAPQPAPRSAAIWWSSTAVLPGVVAMFGVVAFAGFLAFIPLHALDVGVDRVGTLLLVSSATVIVARFVVARSARQDQLVTIIAAGLACEALGLLLIAVWTSPVGLWVAVAVMSAGWAVVLPWLVLAATRGAGAGERTRAVATFTMFTDVGVAVGPIMMGLVASFAGYGGAFVAGAVITAGGLLLTRPLTASPSPIPN